MPPRGVGPQINEPDTSNPPEPPKPEGEKAPVEDTSTSKSGKYVAWSNVPGDALQGSHRVVYAHEWKQAGIKDQGDVTWGPVNGYRVPVESLTKEAVNKIKGEPGFRVIEVDDEGNEKT